VPSPHIAEKNKTQRGRQRSVVDFVHRNLRGTTSEESPVTDGSAVMMTVSDLLSRAKRAIASGEASLHAAAEDIAGAQEQGATQRHIAEAIGKSAAWVNRLLQWRRDGCHSDTPFGPESKAARQRAKRVQATEQKTQQSATTGEAVEAAAARARAETAKAEADKAKAEARKAKADAAKAKAEAEARAAREQQFRASFANSTKELDWRQRDRLVKLLGMLGSNQDGERATAAKMVEEHRVAIGLMWDELIIPAATTVKARAA
jgi:hypothetical protein